MPAQPPQPPERPDQDSDLVFVDDAEEARKPKPPKPSQRTAPQRPPSERTQPPGTPSQRAGRQPKRRPSGQHRRPSGRHKRPPSGQHKRPERAERPETRRVDRPTRRRAGKGSQSVRLPAPSFERTGPDPHLRVDGDASSRPYCLVSAVMEAPILLSREKSTVIGRGEGVGVRVRSHMVSREHAEILWAGDGFYVRDLGSTNGSFVNGYLLREQVPLRDGDLVYVGNFEIQVKVLRPGEDPEEHLQGMTRPFRPPPKDEG